MLIPSGRVQDPNFYNPIQIINENIETVQLTDVERKLGIDLKLSDEGDLVIGTDGDLRQVMGIRNGVQALKHKYTTPIGSLRPHPQYGLIKFYGRKFREDEFTLVEAEVRRTTATDPRFNGLNKVQIVRERDKIGISVEAAFANIDAPIQVDTSVSAAV